MRQLTITRKKRFVACLGTMKIYIQADEGDTKINGITCRKLGTLKNGETASFTVGEDAARLFVIADNLSKDFCNEYYDLPEGSEDIALTGKNEYNPATGNAFRFDGNDTGDVVSHRRKGKRLGIVILSISIIVGFVIGCFLGNAIIKGNNDKAKTFSSDDMSITLTGNFRSVEYQGFAACYESRSVAVFALKEPFSLLSNATNISLTEYGQMVLESNGMSSENLKSKDGLTFFTFEKEVGDSGEIYKYYSYVYKSDDAFWLIQFAVEAKNADNWEDRIEKWAGSVSFLKQPV